MNRHKNEEGEEIRNAQGRAPEQGEQIKDLRSEVKSLRRSNLIISGVLLTVSIICMESVTQIIAQIVGKIPDSEKEIAIIAMNAYADGFIARSGLESPKQTA